MPAFAARLGFFLLFVATTLVLVAITGSIVLGAIVIAAGLALILLSTNILDWAYDNFIRARTKYLRTKNRATSWP